MLPPPMTSASSQPSSWTSWISRANVPTRVGTDAEARLAGERLPADLQEDSPVAQRRIGMPDPARRAGIRSPPP